MQQHNWRDPHADEALGPHPVLCPVESAAWLAHFGDDAGSGSSPAAKAAAGGAQLCSDGSAADTTAPASSNH